MIIGHFFLISDDDTRVILSQLDGEEGSDYINANHIDVRILSSYIYSVYIYIQSLPLRWSRRTIPIYMYIEHVTTSLYALARVGRKSAC